MKITEDQMHENCSGKCERCGASYEKTSQLEPDVGYVSKVNGEFVTVCSTCFAELPEKDRAIKQVFESMFLVGIRGDGESPLISEEGIETPYRRSPTPYEVKSACREIAENLSSMDTANKIGGFLVQLQQQQHQPVGNAIQMPRKRG